MRMTGNVSKGFADYLQVVQRGIVAGIQQIELVHSRFVEGISRKHVCNCENGGFEFRKFIRLHAFFKIRAGFFKRKINSFVLLGLIFFQADSICIAGLQIQYHKTR